MPRLFQIVKIGPNRHDHGPYGSVRCPNLFEFLLCQLSQSPRVGGEQPVCQHAEDLGDRLSIILGFGRVLRQCSLRQLEVVSQLLTKQ